MDEKARGRVQRWSRYGPLQQKMNAGQIQRRFVDSLQNNVTGGEKLLVANQRQEDEAQAQESWE